MNAYLYPITKRDAKGILNPYTSNFMDSLSNNITFVNRKFPSNMGIFNIIKFILKKLDFIFLNWIEDLPDKKYGKFQTVIMIYMLFPILKIKGTKIIWTVHNKLSHYPSNRKYKIWLIYQLTKKADLILTHSSEGINYVKEINPKAVKKVHFYHHPITKLQPYSPTKSSQFNFLIWGTVIPYKGILEFVEKISKQAKKQPKKMIIAGKVSDKDYLKKLEKACGDFIILRNEYIPNNELTNLINNSESILFTYKNNSVLSSGALMDSLSTGNRIIGPRIGAFIDLEKEGLVETYKDETEIYDIIRKPKTENYWQLVKNFFSINNWTSFGDRFYQLLTTF